MNDRIVTVFGGTGFLGRDVARHLAARNWTVRAASRHPRHAKAMFVGEDKIHPVPADIRNPDSIKAALAGARAAVNAVSLYVERGSDTFDAIHVAGARAVARLAREAGADRLVQISGIGADSASPSLYVRKRGEGELAVAGAFPDAVIVRPAVMFGSDGGFAAAVLGLMRRLPVYPMFGRGETRLQPVAVADVAEAIARLVDGPEPAAKLYEFGGPRVFSYEDFLRTVAREAGIRPILVPFPFGGWHLLARVAEILPHPPVTRNQVELMEVDTVTTPGRPGLADLGIAPRPVEDTVRELVRLR